MSKPSRILSFILRFLGALFVAWTVLITALSFIYIELMTHPPCPPSVPQVDGFEAVTIHSSGLMLSGWWHPPQQSGAAAGDVILLLAGSGGNRDAMLPEAEMLARHGYGVLTLEGRNCVNAQATLGYREVEDLQAMVDFARAQPGVKWLGVMGFSVGGTTAVRGAARIPSLRAIIVIGSYANLYDEMTADPVPSFSVEWQIQRMVALVYFLRVGVLPAQVSPITDIPRLAPRPVLFIFGENEIERTRGRQQYQVAAEPKTLWVVPGVGHGGYFQANPQEFEQRVTAFLEQSR